MDIGKPALTLALSPRRGDGGGAVCLFESCDCRSSGWEVQGFRARTLGSENSFREPVFCELATP